MVFCIVLGLEIARLAPETTHGAGSFSKLASGKGSPSLVFENRELSIRRPYSLGPISRGVDHTQDRDDFTAAACNDFVCNDVRQSGYGFLICASNPPGSAGSKIFKLGYGLAKAIDDSSGRHRIVGRDAHQLFLQVIKCIARPEDRPCHRVCLRPVSSTAAISSAIALSFGTRWPEVTSARPRLIPSMIACS